MSGPKVVRVVTREELIARGRSLLTRLDQMISIWKRDGQRIGQLTAEEITQVQERRATLESLLVQAKFAELQRRVPQEIGYLTQDLEQRRQRAVEATTQALLQERQQRENAGALLRALQAKAPGAPQDLVDALRSISAATMIGKEAERVLSQGFMLLSTPAEPVGLTDAQRDLAKRLAEGQPGQTLAEWVAKHVKPQEDRLQSVDRRIAEVSVWLGESAAVAFAQRLRAIEAEEPSASRNMRIDALVVDVSTAVKSAQHQSALLQEAQVVLAELSVPSDPAVERARAGLRAAVTAKDFAAMPAAIEAARTALAERQREEAAAARRAAILSGLSALGYEVREGMSTAWAKNGRVVLSKPSTPGYGVELAGGSDVDRLQVRAVAFSATRDMSRDLDIETVWCGEVGKLQSLLSENGSLLSIERALGIGETPLKTIDTAAVEGTSTPQVRGAQ
jgi:hypothetical protein